MAHSIATLIGIFALVCALGTVSSTATFFLGGTFLAHILRQRQRPSLSPHGLRVDRRNTYRWITLRGGRRFVPKLLYTSTLAMSVAA